MKKFLILALMIAIVAIVTISSESTQKEKFVLDVYVAKNVNSSFIGDGFDSTAIPKSSFKVINCNNMILTV